jgi:uncharacterized protein (TIGR02594 family)
MNFPSNYEWLGSLGVLPRCIQEALKLHGTAEVVGKGSNATIIGWRDELNQNGVKIAGYSDDDIPWCGLFAAIVAFRARGAAEVVKEPLWALNWAKFGGKSPQAGLGDVLAFQRNGGGHVGFYIAEDATCYHVLGGNQSNRVSITRVEKSRCKAVRRPPYRNMPNSVKRYAVNAKGAVSKNEA